LHGNLLARQPDLIVPGKRTVFSVEPGRWTREQEVWGLGFTCPTRHPIEYKPWARFSSYIASVYATVIGTLCTYLRLDVLAALYRLHRARGCKRVMNMYMGGFRRITTNLYTVYLCNICFRYVQDELPRQRTSTAEGKQLELTCMVKAKPKTPTFL
jgi:hypothetical protein